ncbi:unnamed protein product [Caenorhabditis angaria]|uniref:Uncharacterized protein n=1 Tax=Caenorhabditis angaria TaxID=860376 RepID=A0A9P1I7P7_9PELO|nr:unnamed protein product [Caenorhabditis angaria]
MNNILVFLVLISYVQTQDFLSLIQPFLGAAGGGGGGNPFGNPQAIGGLFQQFAGGGAGNFANLFAPKPPPAAPNRGGGGHNRAPAPVPTNEDYNTDLDDLKPKPAPKPKPPPPRKPKAQSAPRPQGEDEYDSIDMSLTNLG